MQEQGVKCYNNGKGKRGLRSQDLLQRVKHDVNEWNFCSRGSGEGFWSWSDLHYGLKMHPCSPRLLEGNVFQVLGTECLCIF